jgi:hypothetical protein
MVTKGRCPTMQKAKGKLGTLAQRGVLGGVLLGGDRLGGDRRGDLLLIDLLV